jgi:signal transduction histidine kinase
LGQIDDIDHSPCIRIAVTQLYDDIWIRFQHNGESLSDEEQQYLFEPFASQDKDNDQKSMGQRLSFTHFIITEQHHGQIAVVSDNGNETIFSIQLPLK